MMVMVAVMDRQLVHVRTVERAAASPADPRIHAECLLTITPLAQLAVAPGLGDDAIEFALVNTAFHGGSGTGG